MMGQTLERLFEQKVLTMPKEVSSTVQYVQHYTYMYMYSGLNVRGSVGTCVL